MFDYLVIGKGLIGSAATRYLSQQNASVAVVGTDEPNDWQTHQGVFSSHYDQGRITRILDQDITWAKLAEASISEYKTLEQASGIQFHNAAGCLNVGLAGEDTRSAKTQVVAKELNVLYNHYSSDEARGVLPHLAFPEGRDLLFEHGEAGYVNPRSLIKAQLNVARKNASILSDEVSSLNIKSSSVELKTSSGETLMGRKVLVAAGAYTNFLLDNPLSFSHLPRTIVKARVSGQELERLKNMPSIIFYEGLTSKELSGIYVLPPIKYPDGHSYIKLGGRLEDIMPLESRTDFLDWFHSNASQTEADLLKEALHNLIPDLKADVYQSNPCVVSNTTSTYPYLDELVKDRVYVAAGGNGASAKSSNEIGRLGARMLLGHKPDPRFKALTE